MQTQSPLSLLSRGATLDSACRLVTRPLVVCTAVALSLANAVNAQTNVASQSPPPIPSSTSAPAPDLGGGNSGLSTQMGLRGEELRFAPDGAMGKQGSDVVGSAQGLNRILDMTQRVKQIIGDRAGTEGNRSGTPRTNRMRLTDGTLGDSSFEVPASSTSQMTGRVGGSSLGADLETRRDQSAKEIVERIELLKRLRAEASQKRIEAIQNGESLIPGPSESPRAGNPESMGTPVPGGQFVTAEAANASPAAGSLDGMGAGGDESGFAPGAMDSAGDAASPFGADVEQIFPEPVDPMKLGESLFRTGNYAAALKSFESVEVDKLTDSEHLWLDLLISLAKRRLGILGEAEEGLRDIANVKSRDNSVPTARFWLKQTEFSRKTRPLLDQLNNEYEMLVERAKEYAKSQ